MQPVTAYKSFDGKLFENPKDCADYETHCKCLAIIVDKLPRFSYTGGFQVGDQYYQHDGKLYLSVRNQFFKYLRDLYKNTDFSNHIDMIGSSKYYTWIVNILLMSGDTASIMAWKYIGLVDDQFRQWSDHKYLDNQPKTAIPIQHDNTDII